MKHNRKTPDTTVALAGNPNVGKSTVFNGLTGMNQHTGNWPGKTVANASGSFHTRKHTYRLVDIPGTYSLMAHSSEEEIARNFICFENPDITVIVCDATCLERNLNLVLQIAEITPRIIVCINLMDEAERKKIHVDLKKLENSLHLPVIGMVAKKKGSLKNLADLLDRELDAPPSSPFVPVHYPPTVEAAISMVEKAVIPLVAQNQSTRWLSLKLLEQDELMLREIRRHLGTHFMQDHTLKATLNNALLFLHSHHIDSEKLKDVMVSTLFSAAESIASDTVSYDNRDTYDAADRKLDRILTGKITGLPIMLCLLTLIFWLTIAGANYPSDFLTGFFLKVQFQLTALFHYLHAPDWLHGVLILGVYRVLTRVISVMLPPMAIFFPLFTLLEDTGYLPRIAFNLDKPFQRCSACGKQALTMCMGFGCNAVGVVGCRIIDSPRERLLAILTNNFVPCNGRFPTLIALLGMFLIGNHCGAFSSLLSALALSGIVLLGIFITFVITKLLSVTLLRGVPSSFTLELPPYRRPQTGKVIVRSFFDRTLFVLSRAVAVSAPAGLVLWLMANLSVNGSSILNHCSDFLHPFASLMGLDGVILLAFILGFPANEIVIPIIIMAYTSQGSLQDFGSLSQTRELLILNGWSWKTAVSTMLFSLFHFPCSTTLLTIKKETGSMKWTALAAILPTSAGILLCMLFTLLSNLLF